MNLHFAFIVLKATVQMVVRGAHSFKITALYYIGHVCFKLFIAQLGELFSLLFKL